MADDEDENENEKETDTSVKKGPWTVVEDTVLVDYIKQHGEGNWNMVERNSGLMRCGKSCRLRWFNHLRPNLRRGAFSPEEERVVVEMHAQFGNRWARMAMQLPGRSDNEIKNFWNTRAKRLERAGLPLYPENLLPQQNQMQDLSQNQNQNQNHTTHFSIPSDTYYPNPNDLIGSPLESPSPTPQNLEFRLSPELSMGPFNYSRPVNPNPVLYNSGFPQQSSYPITGNGNNLSVSLTSTSYTMNYPNYEQANLSSSYPNGYPYQSQSHFNTYNPSPSPIPLPLPNPNPNPPLSMINSSVPSFTEEEVSLMQSLLGLPPAANETGYEYGVMEMSNSYDSQYFSSSVNRNDGMLEDICGLSQPLAPNNTLFQNNNELMEWNFESESNSPDLITGMQSSDPIENATPFDDDLSALLESFPVDVPTTSNWYLS